MTRTLTRDDARAAIYGGCILGGGGGGWIADGEAAVDDLFRAYPEPTMIGVEDLGADDAVACVALVGAPSAQEASLSAEQMIESVRLVQDLSDRPITALMTNENGAGTTINGWLQAAALGLPVVDSPANGRAHPTGSMGSMGLHADPEYTSVQGFSGGAGTSRLSGGVSGTLSQAADAVRQMSVLAGGLVGVCRNPVPASYLQANAAVGGITQAIELGRCYLDAPESPDRIAAVTAHLNAEVLIEGEVTDVSLISRGGFDVGAVQVEDVELTFWNEYMTADRAGTRLATFPELIMTLDAETGAPIVTAEIGTGRRVSVIRVGVEHLLLGSPMRDASLLAGIEPIINRDVLSHQEELWR